MNKTRLNPYATKPSTSAAAVVLTAGSCAPNRIATTRFVGPATAPFTIASQLASVSDTLRVRLLSRAQQAHAPTTASAGHTLATCACPVGTAMTTAPATIASIPKTTRRPAGSRNTIQAITAVRTPSAFNNSDAPEAGIDDSPN